MREDVLDLSRRGLELEPVVHGGEAELLLVEGSHPDVNLNVGHGLIWIIMLLGKVSLAPRGVVLIVNYIMAL